MWGRACRGRFENVARGCPVRRARRQRDERVPKSSAIDYNVITPRQVAGQVASVSQVASASAGTRQSATSIRRVDGR